MSHTDPKSLLGKGAEDTQNGKGSMVSPKLSGDEHVELADIMAAGPPALSPSDDIMQLARLGDIPGIQRLFDNEKFDGGHCDDEGITPLHVCVSL